MAIIVFGSINMDLVARVPKLPAPGETLAGSSFVTVPGGKGANQAVACARLGAPTKMIGRVGEDVFGESLRNHLQMQGVQIEGVGFAPRTPSGVALIAVSESGENEIIVIPGANGKVGEGDIQFLESTIQDAQVLLLQLEVPMEAVLGAARLAHAHGVTVILDPAPARELPVELYGLVDILTPNLTEAGVLASFTVEDEAGAQKAASILQKRGVPTVIIKMGAAGAYCLAGGEGRFWPAYPVTVVDTVAAGDAFNGAFASALGEGKPLNEALRWGMAAGALAVTKPGAQEAMPYREELLKLVR